mmetsp:Transcript_49702/g.123551  ORF Transcript_49702/g.123551 Transcript_49702/m.123551 type:complete len:223 (+) Transcript_49702:1550-2218(+)
MDHPGSVLFGDRRATVEADAEERAFHKLKASGVRAVRQQRGALCRPLVAVHGGQHGGIAVRGVVLYLLVVQEAERGQLQRRSHLSLELVQAERLACSGVHRDGHDRAIAQHGNVLRISLLLQRVHALHWHPCHAEDTSELVHVERVATHLFDRVLACFEHSLHVKDTEDEQCRRLHVRYRHAKVRHHAEPVDVNRHGRARTEVRKLLPPLFYPVAFTRRTLL